MKQAISANRLTDGIVVFFTAGEWVERLAEASFFADKAELEAALEQAKQDETRNIVVEAYAFDVNEGPQGPRAGQLREAIRAEGPTVHRDHGKQAQGR